MSLPNLDAASFLEKPKGSFVHQHFWQRALSRRAFIAGASAGMGGAALAGAGLPLLASAGGAGAPKPVPGTANIGGVHFHFNFFGAGDASTVFDFNGGMAAAPPAPARPGGFSGHSARPPTRATASEAS